MKCTRGIIKADESIQIWACVSLLGSRILFSWIGIWGRKIRRLSSCPVMISLEYLILLTVKKHYKIIEFLCPNKIVTLKGKVPNKDTFCLTFLKYDTFHVLGILWRRIQTWLLHCRSLVLKCCTTWILFSNTKRRPLIFQWFSSLSSSRTLWLQKKVSAHFPQDYKVLNHL